MSDHYIERADPCTGGNLKRKWHEKRKNTVGTGISKSDSTEKKIQDETFILSNSSSPIPPKKTRMHPAFSRTRVKLKNGDEHREGTLFKSSLKPSFVSSFTSTNQLVKPNQSDMNVASSVANRTFDAVSQSALLTTKALSEHLSASSSSNQCFGSQLECSSSNKIKLKRKTCKLPHSNKENSSLMDELDIGKLYEENLELKVIALIEENTVVKSRVSHMRKKHLQIMKQPSRRTTLSTCHKSFLLPHNLRKHYKKSHSLKRSKKSNENQMKDRKKERKEQFKKIVEPQETANEIPKNFVENLLGEFPGIELAPSILKYTTEKYEQHLFKLHSRVKDCLLQKSKSELQAEKAAERQRKISNILKKDIQEKKYLNDIKEQRFSENMMKYKLRDSRLKTAQMKQYHEEFQVEMRKKMERKNIAEELIFERVFKEIVKIQNDHVEYLCQQVKQAGEEDAVKYLNYLASLENLHQSQFSLLSEKLAGEINDAQNRVKMEKQNFDKMQRDFQEILKKEIRSMQQMVIEQIRDTHFRELDAEQVINRARNQCI